MPVGGRDYFLLMTDQSRRAQEFRRQLSWFRMRGQLVAEPPQTIVIPSEEPSAPVQQG